MKLHAVNNNIVATPIEEDGENKSSGGIILSGNEGKALARAKVKSVGGVCLENHDELENDVALMKSFFDKNKTTHPIKAGDVVILSPSTTIHTDECEGEKVWLFKAEDVLAIEAE